MMSHFLSDHFPVKNPLPISLVAVFIRVDIAKHLSFIRLKTADNRSGE